MPNGPPISGNLASTYPGLSTLMNIIAVGNESYGVPGSVSTRGNNPGNLRAGSVGGGTTGVENQTVFPDIETGSAAMTNLIVQQATDPQGSYATFGTQDLTLQQFMSKYSQIQQADGTYKPNPAALQNIIDHYGNGVTGDTKLKDLISSPHAVANPVPDTVYSTVSPAGNMTSSSIDVQSHGTPVTARALAFDTPDVNYSSLFPDVIVNTGLNEVPWYGDKNLITGNPKVRKSVTPVVFELMLKGNTNEILSSSPDGTTYKPGNPLQVQLNASMKSFSVSSKHVFRPHRTRTGWHITMWGMQADTIEGSCTTGVFMNQLGLTDFFSTSMVDAQVMQLVNSGFETFPSFATSENVPQPGVLSSTFTSTNNENLNNQLLQSISGQDPREAFRVAAQDAFTEFLFLFKNNGNVWFNNQASGGATDGYQQVGVDMWSPETATSVTAKSARNNDIMSRGSIIMKFKGTTYFGYFKSLNHTQDAANPFQWTFNFTFQVERTIGNIFSPTGA